MCYRGLHFYSRNILLLCQVENVSPCSEVYSALIAHCWKPGCCSWPSSVPLTSVHSCFRLQRRTLGSSSFSLEDVPIWNYFGFLVLSGEGKVLADCTCSDLCFKNIKHEVLICWVPSQVTASLLVCVSQDKIQWAPSIINLLSARHLWRYTQLWAKQPAGKTGGKKHGKIAIWKAFT